jgi:hypothetical protein
MVKQNQNQKKIDKENVFVLKRWGGGGIKTHKKQFPGSFLE